MQRKQKYGQPVTHFVLIAMAWVALNEHVIGPRNLRKLAAGQVQGNKQTSKKKTVTDCLTLLISIVSIKYTHIS